MLANLGILIKQVSILLLEWVSKSEFQIPVEPLLEDVVCDHVCSVLLVEDKLGPYPGGRAELAALLPDDNH